MNDEVRIGKTGRWTLSLITEDKAHVLATSEWGTVYPFSLKCWRALPLAPDVPHAPALPIHSENEGNV